MDRLDILLLAVAGYVSIVSLVRLMAHHRNRLIAKIHNEIEKQRAAAAAAAAKQAQQDQEAA